MSWPKTYDHGVRVLRYWCGWAWRVLGPSAVVLLACLGALGYGRLLTVLVVLAGLLLLWRLASLATTLHAMWFDRRKPPCTAPCACGCGHLFDTVPEGECGKTCDCGCGRPCVVHRGHRGEHAS